jgi:hypothetical protein
MHVEAGFLVRSTAERFGPRIALSAAARSFTFTELNETANRVGSALLALGAKRGDRVGVLAYNTPEVVHAWFGFEKHNLVRVVLHSHFSMEAHVWSLNHVEASTLVFDTRFAADVDRHRRIRCSIPPRRSIASSTGVSSGPGMNRAVTCSHRSYDLLSAKRGGGGERMRANNGLIDKVWHQVQLRMSTESARAPD